MPTYDYKCDACGFEFEKFQSMSSAPIKKCPKCGKNKVKRLIGTGAALIFKGSGFYITDYRDKSYSDKAKAESGSGSKDSSKDGSKDSTSGDSKKTETKAESKTEAAPAPAPKPEKSETKPSKSAKKGK
jgi:putative FmdB family regulatory protein